MYQRNARYVKDFYNHIKTHPLYNQKSFMMYNQCKGGLPLYTAHCSNTIYIRVAELTTEKHMA